MGPNGVHIREVPLYMRNVLLVAVYTCDTASLSIILCCSELARIGQLEIAAKAAGKGKWSKEPEEKVCEEVLVWTK